MTTGTSSAAFSLAFWNTSRIFRSVSPTYLLSSSGPFHVEEVSLDLLAALCREFLRQAVGHRLGDHRLAASWRPIEEHALHRPELVRLVVVGVEVR
jgi:hypothetical protein